MGKAPGLERADSPYLYDAYVSYTHQPRDAQVAARLAALLEIYRVPRALVRQGTPPRLCRVFRDRDDLSVSPQLAEELRRNLEASRFLIVLCSPRACASHWVAEEVRMFRALGRADAILPVLVEGEPKDAFPAGLTSAGDEPLAADVRARSLRATLRLLRVEKLRILACLLGCSFDDLRQRERQRSVRRRLIVAVALLALLAGAALATILMLRARDLSLAREAEVFLERARTSEADRNYGEAAVWFALARTRVDGVEARFGLALDGGRALELRRVLGEALDLRVLVFTPDGERLIVGRADGTLTGYNAVTGERAYSLRLGEPALAVRVVRDRRELGRGGMLVVAAGKSLRVFEALTGEEAAQLRFPLAGVASALAMHPREPMFAVSDGRAVWFYPSGLPDTPPLFLETTAAGLEFRHADRRLTVLCRTEVAEPETREWAPDGPPPAPCPTSASKRPLSLLDRHVAWKADPTGRWIVRTEWGKDAEPALTLYHYGADMAGTLVGHSRPVLAAGFSPDGQLLATCAADGTLRLWDVASRRHLATATIQCDARSKLALAPSGAGVAVATASGNLELWRLPHVPLGATPMTFARASADGRYRVVVDEETRPAAEARSGDKSVVDGTVWDLETGAGRSIFVGAASRGFWFTAEARFSWAGRTLGVRVAGSANVRVYDLAADRQVDFVEYRGEPTFATSFDVSDDATAVGYSDGIVRLRPRSGTETTMLRLAKPVLQVAMAPDGRAVVARDGDKVRVSDRSGDRVAEVKQRVPTDATAGDYDVSFDASGRFLFVPRTQGWVVVDIESRRTVADLRPAEASRLPMVTTDVELTALAQRILPWHGTPFALDAPRDRLVVSDVPGTVKMLSPTTGKQSWQSSLGTTRAVSFALSQDGNRLAIADDDATIRVWDATTGAERYRLVGHEAPVVAVAFSPQGDLLVSAGQETTPTLRVWDVARRLEVRRLELRRDKAAVALSFSSDGLSLAWSTMEHEMNVMRLEPATSPGDDVQRTLTRYALVRDGATLWPKGYVPPRRPEPVH